MKKMLPFLLIMLSALVATPRISALLQDQTLPTTLILVRHAEKTDDGTDNPHLTLDGIRRAEELSYLLDHVQLTAVYSTPFHRTKETAEPSARRQAKKIRLYQPNEEEFLERMLKEHAGGNILIVGHSTTVPVMANALTGTEDYPWLHESVYDNLFIVTVLEMGKAKVTRIRFGAHTPEK
jgi:2,3-bisphosphoglycerate-dependent phosphoglycerate mutase